MTKCPNCGQDEHKEPRCPKGMRICRVVEGRHTTSFYLQWDVYLSKSPEEIDMIRSLWLRSYGSIGLHVR